MIASQGLMMKYVFFTRGKMTKMLGRLIIAPSVAPSMSRRAASGALCCSRNCWHGLPALSGSGVSNAVLMLSTMVFVPTIAVRNTAACTGSRVVSAVSAAIRFGWMPGKSPVMMPVSIPPSSASPWLISRVISSVIAHFLCNEL